MKLFINKMCIYLVIIILYFIYIKIYENFGITPASHIQLRAKDYQDNYLTSNHYIKPWARVDCGLRPTKRGVPLYQCQTH